MIIVLLWMLIILGKGLKDKDYTKITAEGK